jgi:hypothetical protein
MGHTTSAEQLKALPLEGWEATKDTLHLWVQIVGKVRMASVAPRNHWWHVPLYVDVRGLTTRSMHAPDGTTFRIDFDFVEHALVVSTDQGAVETFALVDGLSVADFDEELHATLRQLGTWRFASNRTAYRSQLRSLKTETTRPTTGMRSSDSGGSSTGPMGCWRSSRAGTAARAAPFISSGTRSTWR